MNSLLLLALFSAVVTKVAGVPIAGEQIVLICPDKEQWYDCGPCEGTCSNLHPACPIMPMCQRSARSGCGCIEGHVRDDKQRCIPKELCQTVEPAEVLPPVVPAEELHPPVVPAAEVHPPMVPVQQMCPEKEMWNPTPPPSPIVWPRLGTNGKYMSLGPVPTPSTGVHTKAATFWACTVPAIVGYKPAWCP
uniref:TIL domain-containing protein n=1 Tax=Plectus sambesii TaxID=2011161 RepID=A0A914XJY1_9BILA